MKPMTNKQYLHAGGSKCPVCRQNDISHEGHMDGDGNSGWQKTICEKCGASWYEEYKLVGYSMLETNNQTEPNAQTTS